MSALERQQLRAILEEAWQSLTPDQRQRTYLSYMAYRLLTLAAQGEGDPPKLKDAALQLDDEGPSAIVV